MIIKFIISLAGFVFETATIVIELLYYFLFDLTYFESICFNILKANSRASQQFQKKP